MTIEVTVNLNIFGLFMKDVIVYDLYFTPIILVNKVAEDKKLIYLEEANAAIKA